MKKEIAEIKEKFKNLDKKKVNKIYPLKFV